ncbi:carbohydrate-binding domain-containing protein [Ruminococcus sp.]|uniref:carbohydrate-binding domain-containing protein n=1 Tax=Ruminococcus sp. TaxID=41978 RepID=UPI00265CAEAE|nr:carbohydrate-binding domain-containing protein [uncultured Ruminococcus sp.]
MKKISHRYVRKTAAGVVALSMLCAAAIPSVLAMPAGAASASGDLNGDGSVTAADVAILQTSLLGGTALTAEQYANADVTGDGAVDGLDLTRLRQMAAVVPVSDAIAIHLSDSGITVEGDTKGVTAVSGKAVTISASGNYTVDGSITDGQILVNIPDTTADSDAVSLYLQDVTMTSSNGAPCILGQSAKKLKLTCSGENTLTDTAAEANADTSGVIYGDCDITVTKNSTGTLNITSSMNTAIRSKDDIKLNGGAVVINTDVDDTSDADAIRANNTLEVDGASVSITSSADGLKSSKEDVSILSGKVSIKVGNDAVQAATALNISGGTVIASGDRGFTLDENGTLAITGGDVLATATDYAFGMDSSGAAVTVDTSGCTQGVVQLDYAAEWKKSNAVTLKKGSDTVFEMTPNKKYTYVLASGAKLSGTDSYTLYTGGTQMNHSGSDNGTFAMTGTLTKFTDVKELTGGSELPDDDSVVTALVYSGSSVTATNASGGVVSNPSNLTISGANVTITASSEISVSGESTSGQLAVNVDKTAEPEGKVVLNLEGLTLSNSSAAPIYVEAIGDEVQISAKNGTTNTISDGTSHTDTYVDSDGNTNTVNGAIFSRDDLKLKGKGTLIVNGNTEDGIVCKNDLKIWNGNITVNAADDGIRGNDSVRIGDPDAADYSSLSVTVNTNNGSSGGDGIKTNSDEDGKGYVTINGGTVNIDSYADGIQAEQTFTMNGGELNITTYQGSNFTGSASGGNGGWGGGMGGNDGNSNKTDISAKGIKAVGVYDEAGTTWQSGGDLIVNGGTITIDSSDDSLHCGGDMQLLGGSMTLATADDGAHSDHALTIGSTGGDYDAPYVNITKSYEGIEGVDITQNSGTVMVTSSDDGYNAAGGADSSGNNNSGGWGQGSWGGPGGGSSSDGSQTMTFNGGYAYVNAAGDGLDSNGNIYFNGGYVFVSQTGGGNGPLDCGDSNNSITYSGGTVIAAGSSDMFETPSSYSFLSTTSVSAGQTITFTDASGNVLATFTLPNGSAEMVMCSQESSVTCYTGGTLSGTTYFASQDSTNRCGYGGTISGGTAVSASSGGNSGPGGGGNNRPF